MSRRWQAFWLAMGTLACLAALPIGAVFAILSPLIFYGQGDLSNPVLWLAFLLVIGLWVVCILGPFGAWVAFSYRQTGRSWAAMASPVLWTLALLVTLQFVPG